MGTASTQFICTHCYAKFTAKWRAGISDNAYWNSEVTLNV